jgi:hypothetical protein
MLLPARHPNLAAREMLVSFDIDCGELVPGHHLVARGLATSAVTHQMRVPGGARPVTGVDFLYDFVPGLTQDEEEDGFFPYLVEFSYTADQALPWEVDGGGAMGPSVGGASTPGFEGPWPIPDGARLLMFHLTGFDRDTRLENDEPDGTLEVNLTTRTAAWTSS